MGDFSKEDQCFAMPDENRLYELSELFKIFADSTRVRILYCLRCGERSVGDIAEAIGLTQSAVSHQLVPMKKARLLKSRRAGQTVFYSLADDHVLTILSQGEEHVSE